MRKILLGIVAMLVLMQPAMAEFVRPDAAARYAQGVLGMKESPAPENSGSMLAASRDGQAAEPEYYVFNNPEGGWVIIAADDRVNPIIGYSHEGSFVTAGMPDNLKWWMNGVAGTIDEVRKSGGEAPESVRAAWESLLVGVNPVTEGKKKYIETALWSQTEPYNDLCPIVNGETKRSVTGCVATAMAIVMQSNRWPANGKGVIGGYTIATKETYIPAYSIEKHTYDWDVMSDENVVSGNTALWTDVQKQQVAQLMHDCGVAMQMDYDTEASGTISSQMLKAMRTNMSYSDKIAQVRRSSYKLDKWFSLIKNEIDNGRVVYYGALSDFGGHAFVCDGYESDTISPKLRINWGWSGDCNGYYTLDLTISRYGLNFIYEQEAIVGLAPDTAVVETEEITDLTILSNGGFYGIRPVTPADMTLGSEVSFEVGWLFNTGTSKKTLEFKICLEDKDGNIRQRGWDLKMDLPAANGMMYSDETNKAVIMVTPLFTDRFRLYVSDGKGGWKPVMGNYDLLPDVEGVVCGVIQDPVIIIPDGCSAGQEIELSLSLGFTHVKSVEWSVNGTALDANKVKLTKGRNDIRADVVYLDGTRGSIYKTLQFE